MAARGQEAPADLAVIGGGLGGVAAALAALRSGARVILTEEIGLARRAVDQPGRAARRARLDRAVRLHPQLPRAPRRASATTTAALSADRRGPARPVPQPRRRQGQPPLPRAAGRRRRARAADRRPTWPAAGCGSCVGHRPVAAVTDGDRVRAVTRPTAPTATVHGQRAVRPRRHRARRPAAAGRRRARHRLRVPGRDRRAERARRRRSRPTCRRSPGCFAVEHRAGEDHTIDRPGAVRASGATSGPDGWPGPLLGLVAPDPRTLATAVRDFLPNARGRARRGRPERGPRRPGPVGVPPDAVPASFRPGFARQRRHARQLADDRLPARAR